MNKSSLPLTELTLVYKMFHVSLDIPAQECSLESVCKTTSISLLCILLKVIFIITIIFVFIKEYVDEKHLLLEEPVMTVI